MGDEIKNYSNYLLTDEDKHYLNRMNRYIYSLGFTKRPSIDEFFYEVYPEDGIIEAFEEFKEYVSNSSYFTNGTKIDIPTGYSSILSKLLNSIDVTEFYNENPKSLDSETINLSVVLDTIGNRLGVYLDYYYLIDDDYSTYFDEEESKDNIDKLIDSGINPDIHDVLTLTYDGGGDSGYLNTYFSNGEPVPNFFESWAYNMLESEHNGWEINEGSHGVFVIDFKSKTITLDHSYNRESSKVITLYEENY